MSVYTLNRIDSLNAIGGFEKSLKEGDREARPKNCEEVLHLAKMTPLLISGISECETIMEEAIELVRRGEKPSLDELRELLDHCSRIRSLAESGYPKNTEIAH